MGIDEVRRGIRAAIALPADAEAREAIARAESALSGTAHPLAEEGLTLVLSIADEE